ncbi:MAG: NAD-dependent epimerase/dehydratase family protein [Oleiphilaceae bacterium]|nr:NAD-dependent epimerase/dehydratase family protein [Oleiphilaceae bacterium]
MSKLSLVTGANGHLGNNLVRVLLSKGEQVRAGVRNLENTSMFEDLECERVYAEMTDAVAMRKALEGVDVLYHVAAVFKHWSKDPIADIITPNSLGTEIVLNAALQAGVRKIIYVSSVAAVGHDGSRLDENTWNQEARNAYYHSKIVSEQKAWEIAKKYQLDMVSVLPSAMVGPNIENLTDTMRFIDSIQKQTLPVDPNFYFNFVDVRDVAEGIYLASQRGKTGERYILANEHSFGLPEVIALARKLDASYRSPPKVPKLVLYGLAFLDELKARLTGKPAELLRSQVRLFYGVKQEYDISKAKRELGFKPRSPEDAIYDAMEFLRVRSSH